MSKDKNIVMVNKVMKWWKKDFKMARHTKKHTKKRFICGEQGGLLEGCWVII
jgi:hypothetical protein